MWVQSECFTLKDSKENNRSHHFFTGKARIGGLGYKGVLQNFTLYSYTVGLFKRCIHYFFNLKIYLQQKGIRPTEEAKRDNSLHKRWEEWESRSPKSWFKARALEPDRSQSSHPSLPTPVRGTAGKFPNRSPASVPPCATQGRWEYPLQSIVWGVSD